MFFLSLIKSFIPALVIIGVYEFIKDPEYMEEYEKEFIETNKHENELDHYIKSGFNIEDTTFLIHICAEAQKLQENEIRYQPQVENHHIAFKKVKHLPYFVEVIRCHKKYAVMKAPEAQCAYLLKKGKSDPNIGDKIFYFHSKFLYHKRNLTSEEINERIKLYTDHCSIHQKQIQEGELSRPTGIVEDEDESGEEHHNYACLSKLFATNGDKDLTTPDADEILNKRTESEKSLPESTLPEIDGDDGVIVPPNNESIAAPALTVRTEGKHDDSERSSSVWVSDNSFNKNIPNHPLQSNEESRRLVDPKLEAVNTEDEQKDLKRLSTPVTDLFNEETQNHPIQNSKESKTFQGGFNIRDKDQRPSRKK